MLLLDVIIPNYNNYKGLRNTLFSMGRFVGKEILKVTIVDDCSPDITDEMYQTIIKDFPYLDIQILRMPTNRGPGWAREYGIRHTNGQYILFIDSGDLFISQVTLVDYYVYILKHSNLLMFIGQYLYETPRNEFLHCLDHYEFHGTILARKLINKYHLKVPTANSYMHEDNAFLMLCRILAAEDKGFCIDKTTPYVIHVVEPNSLTQKNNNDFYYHYCASGLIENGIEVIQNMLRTFPGYDMTEYIYQLACFAYFILYDLQFKYQDYYKESKEVYKQFYFQYVKPIINNDNLRFMEIYYTLQTMALKDIPFENYCVFDIRAFFKSLEEEE